MQTFNEVAGDLLDVKYGVILHGCNCANGFASGVAGAIARAYPEVKKRYHTLWDNVRETPDEDGAKPSLMNQIQPVHIYKDFCIVNGFTQRRYGRDPNVTYADKDAIEVVLLRTLQMLVQDKNLPRHINVPRIGSGLGGLRWDSDVKPIYRRFNKLCVRARVGFTVHFKE